MYNGNFLIPANSKRGQLLFNMFRPIDMWIVGIGMSITFILYWIFHDSISNLFWAIMVLLPFLITAFLVIPVPNYHNMLCVMQNIYKFYFVEKQQYTWKGWCVKDEYKE